MSSPQQQVNPPITQTISITYSFFTVALFSMVFNTSATFLVQLYDTNYKLVDSRKLNMIGSDYNNWQGNDDYVYEWVNQQLQQI